jgi:hypothetical protein
VRKYARGLYILEPAGLTLFMAYSRNTKSSEIKKLLMIGKKMTKPNITRQRRNQKCLFFKGLLYKFDYFNISI